MNIIKKIIKVSCMVLMDVLLLCSCESMVKNNAVNEKGDKYNYEKGKEQLEKNGLIKNGTQTYYYVNNEKQTGWQEINGEWYFFFDDGIVTNAMIEWENEKYRFGDDGKMLKKSFHQLNEGAPLFYFDEDGKMLHDTQREINGDTYIFDSNGYAVKGADYKNVTEPTKSNYNKKTSLQELKNKLQATNFDDSEIKSYLEIIIDYAIRIKNAENRIEKEQLFYEEKYFIDQLEMLVDTYRDIQKYTNQKMNDVELVDKFFEELYNAI